MEKLLKKIVTYLFVIRVVLSPAHHFNKGGDFPKCLVILPFRGVSYFLFFKQNMIKASFPFTATKQSRKKKKF